jgi:hypothetical protein
MMIGDPTSQPSLAQRTGLALDEALQHGRGREVAHSSRVRQVGDLLIEGLDQDQLPGSIDRTRLRSAHGAAALAVNTFLPWQQAQDELPLGGWVGFDAIQFEVRCPTGLRGTPPHLDLLALRGGTAVAVTVRCTEYLTRRRSAIATSYDRLLAETPGLEAWVGQLEQLRARPASFRDVDLGALIKNALALGRTFPDRTATLLYLYWEPLDAERFDEFRRHRAELERLTELLGGGRVAFASQGFGALWEEWSARASPPWLAGHVDRLRARYAVQISDRARSRELS